MRSAAHGVHCPQPTLSLSTIPTGKRLLSILLPGGAPLSEFTHFSACPICCREEWQRGTMTRKISLGPEAALRLSLSEGARNVRCLLFSKCREARGRPGIVQPLTILSVLFLSTS